MPRKWKNAVAPSWGHRLLGIEGLRAFAAVAVMIGHVHGKLGQEAVGEPWSRLLGFTGHGLTLFFALSGFLLFRPFAASLLNGTKRPGTGRYALNRALRIFPGYIVILLVVSFVLGAANTQAPTWGDTNFSRTDGSVGYFWNPIGFIASLLMVQTWFPSTNRLGIGVAWSLSVELVFYILLPLLAILAGWVLARSGRRWVAVALPPLLLFALGLAGKICSALVMRGYPESMRFALEWGDNWVAVLNRSILVHGDLFAYGMVAAVIVVLVQAKEISPRTISTIVLASWGAVVIFGVAGFFGLGRVLNDSLVGVACGALLLVVVLPNRRDQHSSLARALELPPIRYTGMVSYSFYLWHVPVIWLLVALGWVFSDTPLGFAGNILIVFAVSLAFSAATYHLVEAPAMRLKKRTGSRAADTMPTSDREAAPEKA
ncbi:acyltransferase family protein [Microbacterium sp. P04]|uniref:acyltransferase family protein n=1 Tax=Microbacterium sp. P04 TaxID=3366947 RepID=UPI0037469809